MKAGKFIVGKEIIGECVKYDFVDTKDNVLDRGTRVRMKNKSNKRRGKFSRAYVNREIVDFSEKVYVTKDSSHRIDGILEEKYHIPFSVEQNGIVIACQLFGECSEVEKITILSKHAAVHRGQRIPMKCSEFALCYVNPHAEPTYTKF